MFWVCWPFRQLIFNHRQVLLEQLSQETDAAMLLHLSVVVLFQTFTSNIVHAPGKCVPQIITFLKQYLPPEQHDLLTRMQGKSRLVLSNRLSNNYAGEINYSNTLIYQLPGNTSNILQFSNHLVCMLVPICVFICYTKGSVSQLCFTCTCHKVCK